MSEDTVREDPNMCECGHHYAVHRPKCAPWRNPRACSCEQFHHVPDAEAGKDLRGARVKVIA